MVGFHTVCGSPSPFRKTTRRLLAASPGRSSYATSASGLEGRVTVGMLKPQDKTRAAVGVEVTVAARA